jgi:hypothetical protein
MLFAACAIEVRFTYFPIEVFKRLFFTRLLMIKRSYYFSIAFILSPFGIFSIAYLKAVRGIIDFFFII